MSILIYVGFVPESQKLTYRHTLPWGRACVCLLLSLLFLYNPFLTTPGPSATTSACHLLSYRATVANAELFSFNSTDFSWALALPVVSSKIWRLAGPPLAPSSEYAVREYSKPAEEFFSGNLWFRPPPAT